MTLAVTELLEALTPVEQYWAFPGPELLRRVRDLFAAGAYDRFASLVARVNWALVTESYRAGTAWSLADGDPDQPSPRNDPGRRTPARPGRTSRCSSSRR